MTFSLSTVYTKAVCQLPRAADGCCFLTADSAFQIVIQEQQLGTHTSLKVKCNGFSL